MQGLSFKKYRTLYLEKHIKTFVYYVFYSAEFLKIFMIMILIFMKRHGIGKAKQVQPDAQRS